MLTGTATGAAADFSVYNNGALNPDLEYNNWWNAAWTPDAANPAGDGQVFLFNTADGGAAGSMGFMTKSGKAADVMGPLSTATLHFDWYAEGTATYNIRIALNGDYDYPVTVTAENTGKWNTEEVVIATRFPELAEKMASVGSNDVGFPFSIVADNAAGAKLYVSNVYYSDINESYVPPTPVVIPAPESVPTPTLAAGDVVSLLSGAYTPATAFSIGGWGQNTIYEAMDIAGAPVALLKNFNYLGWELASHIDVSECTHMHVDYWTPDGSAFGFTPISPGAEKVWSAPEVKQNEWNSYDVALTEFPGVNFADIFQIKYDLGGGSNGYLANVYFYKDDNAPVSPDPAAKLTYTVTDGIASAYFNYNIKLANIEESQVSAYRVWLDAPGNLLKGESTSKEGSIEVDVTGGDQTYWFKGQVTYTDNDGNEKTINTDPNDVAVTFHKLSDPSVVLPVLTITAGEPKALSATTGELPFTITTDKPELEGVTYHVFCLTTGDKLVGEMNTTDLTGTLQLSDLNEGTKSELWLKAEGIVGTEKTETVQYPGEAQGWTGLFINTSEFADPDKPVMPEITVAAMDPVKTGENSGTLRYEVVLSNDTFFQSLSIKCVTNAFGGAEDVTLAEITETTELTGTLQLEGLKPNAVNGLWVKATITLTDGHKSEEITFPGAAQGWTGLEIDMTQVAIDMVETDNAPVEYFNLQGVKVETPATGMYIRRQGSKVTKVIIR